LVKKILHSRWAFPIKVFIFLLSAGVLYWTLSENENLDIQYWQALKDGFSKRPYYLILAIVLIPLNWSLEAIKWRYLAQKLECISFGQALQGVITGVTMGFVTPHSLGDYAARIWSLSNTERLKSIGAIFLSRISQFYITLYFGTISLVFYVYRVIQAQWAGYDVLIYFTAFYNVVFILLFIYHQKIFKTIASWPALARIVPYFEIITHYRFREINYVLALSLLRYLVFLLQFVLLLYFFEISLSWWLLSLGVTFVFFIKSVLPTFLDLGVREMASVVFFGVFIQKHDFIIFASLTLWLLNLVIPSLVGLFLLWNIRLTVNKSTN
jgi:hypothetical protein